MITDGKTKQKSGINSELKHIICQFRKFETAESSTKQNILHQKLITKGFFLQNFA